MQCRRLGGTDLDVSVICFGPMRAANREPGDDEKSKAGEQALRRALEVGINFLHSSYEYGTRWMMARVLEKHPKRTEVHHVIKLPVPDAKDQGRFDPAKFRMRVEEALRDLHAERISVLQWMWRSNPNEDARRLPLLNSIIDDVTATFEQMRDQGKVGHLMTFPYTAACGQAALDTGRFSGLIGNYNLLEPAFSGLFDQMYQRDMSFLAFRPLYQGILSDERANASALDASDRCADPVYRSAYEKLDALKAIFRDEIGDSMTSFAIRFALAHPVVASIILGLNRVDQVDGAVAAAEHPMLAAGMVDRARRCLTQELPEPPHARSVANDQSSNAPPK